MASINREGAVMLTSTQVAARLGRARSTLIDYVDAGLFPVPDMVKGNRRYWLASTVDAFTQRQMALEA